MQHFDRMHLIVGGDDCELLSFGCMVDGGNICDVPHVSRGIFRGFMSLHGRNFIFGPEFLGWGSRPVTVQLLNSLVLY